MAKTNVPPKKVYTYEGAVAQSVGGVEELKRTVMTCLLFENTFYEGSESIASRLRLLALSVDPIKVAEIAIKAREEMYLRHVPLFLVRELAHRKGCGKLVAETLERVIQRTDELAEFVALYWKEGKQPLSAGVKRGLARAFCKFNAYQLSKYNRDSTVKLRDVLFLCHAKPKDTEQAETWKKLVEGKLESPDTWEVELSAGKNKKETFERLLSEKKLGGLAVLRNLRNMQEAGVSQSLVKERLADGLKKVLPFRFITAARYVPSWEPMLEEGMLGSLKEFTSLSGSTGILIDVSGSMNAVISDKSETTRIDAAAGLAIFLREKADSCEVATFSQRLVVIPARRGFALRDAINQSQDHSSTLLKEALNVLSSKWQKIDRLIVITDEQSQDGILRGWAKQNYLINVAPYKNGISYGNGWTHIDGWSERVIDYIQAYEGVS